MSVVFEGIGAFRSAMEAKIAEKKAATRAAVAAGAHVIQGHYMERAPVVSGALRASCHVEGPVGSGGGWEARIGPSTRYARRIELGFHGTDSLGRTYDQSGQYPLRDALAASRGELSELFRTAWAG